MKSEDIGLIIILSIIGMAIFGLILSRRMRKDTATKSTTGDDALNYGRGTAALTALRAETTGVSPITMIMLIMVALGIFSGGAVLVYYQADVVLVFVGLGMASMGLVTLLRNGFSLWIAIKQGKRWVMFIKKEEHPVLVATYYAGMTAGIVLVAVGLILGNMDAEEIPLWIAILVVLVPVGISAALSYFRIRRG